MEWLTPREAAHALHLSFVAEDGRPSPTGVALVPERKSRVERRVRFLRVVLAHDEPVRDEFLVRHEVRVAHCAYSFPFSGVFARNTAREQAIATPPRSSLADCGEASGGNWNRRSPSRRDGSELPRPDLREARGGGTLQIPRRASRRTTQNQNRRPRKRDSRHPPVPHV